EAARAAETTGTASSTEVIARHRRGETLAELAGRQRAGLVRVPAGVPFAEQAAEFCACQQPILVRVRTTEKGLAKESSNAKAHAFVAATLPTWTAPSESSASTRIQRQHL